MVVLRPTQNDHSSWRPLEASGGLGKPLGASGSSPTGGLWQPLGVSGSSPVGGLWKGCGGIWSGRFEAHSKRQPKWRPVEASGGYGRPLEIMIFRFPFSVFRPPDHGIRFPFSVFRVPFSVFRFPISKFRLPSSGGRYPQATKT